MKPDYSEMMCRVCGRALSAHEAVSEPKSVAQAQNENAVVLLQEVSADLEELRARNAQTKSVIDQLSYILTSSPKHHFGLEADERTAILNIINNISYSLDYQ